ncbi:cell division protein FtsX [Limibacillus halophilus]
MMFLSSDLPLKKDQSARFLPLLVAFMVFLAALALASALAMNTVVTSWQSAFTGKLTVQIPAAEEGEEAVQRERIAAITDLLKMQEGIDEVELLGEAETRALVEPWLGDVASLEELPLPALIAVTLEEEATPDLTSLSIRLQEAAPGAVLDDHQQWLGDVLSSLRSLQVLSLALLAVVGAAAMLAVIYVTRTGLAIHHEVIELLHLIGAKDAYVARQFQRQALVLGVTGGVVGLLLALPVVLLIGYLLSSGEAALFPNVRFGPLEWTLLALLAPLTGIIAMFTARRTVMRSLSELS